MFQSQEIDALDPSEEAPSSSNSAAVADEPPATPPYLMGDEHTSSESEDEPDEPEPKPPKGELGLTMQALNILCFEFEVSPNR